MKRNHYAVNFILSSVIFSIGTHVVHYNVNFLYIHAIQPSWGDLVCDSFKIVPHAGFVLGWPIFSHFCTKTQIGFNSNACLLIVSWPVLECQRI